LPSIAALFAARDAAARTASPAGPASSRATASTPRCRRSPSVPRGRPTAPSASWRTRCSLEAAGYARGFDDGCSRRPAPPTTSPPASTSCAPGTPRALVARALLVARGDAARPAGLPLPPTSWYAHVPTTPPTRPLARPLSRRWTERRGRAAVAWATRVSPEQRALLRGLAHGLRRQVAFADRALGRLLARRAEQRGRAARRP
jgi:hypothetical protein